MTSGAAAPDASPIERIGVLSADLEGKIAGCDRSVLKIFACTPTEVLGEPWQLFFQVTTVPASVNCMRACSPQ